MVALGRWFVRYCVVQILSVITMYCVQLSELKLCKIPSVFQENQDVISKKSLGIIQRFVLSHDSLLDVLHRSLLQLNTKELMFSLFTHHSLL